MAFQDLRGGFNGQVLTRTRAGLTTKSKPKYKYPKNPNVLQGVERLRRASEVWRTLSVDQTAAWRDYASQIVMCDEVTRAHYSPSPKNVFIGLATKFLQVDPQGEVPPSPPTDDFVGDGWLLSASVVPGGVKFSAPSANSPDTTTELLVQPLLNARRSPTKFYKSAGFHTFTDDLSYELSLSPGFYAMEYRFVKVTTGQVSLSMPLGTVEVVVNTESSSIP